MGSGTRALSIAKGVNCLGERPRQAHAQSAADVESGVRETQTASRVSII